MQAEYPGDYSGPLYSEVEHDDVIPNYSKDTDNGGGSSSPIHLLILGLLWFHARRRISKTTI